MLLTQDYTHDIINAVFSTKDLNIKSLKQKIQFLSLLKNESRFPELLNAAKRVYNIIAKAEPFDIKEDLLIETAEKDLHDVVTRVSGMLKDADFKALFELEGPINAFFDTVLVMDKRPEIRKNRLAVLFSVKNTFNMLGDFSKINI
jgi:glycyl-tRNA synthetase beta chain